MIEANEDKLRIVFKKYFTQVKKWIEMSDCIHLIIKECELKISENDVKWCFGMSKMTIKNETENAQNYYKMVFVEFCEFIARIAYIVMKQSNDPFAEKLMFIIDEIFNAFNLTRDEAEVETYE